MNEENTVISSREEHCLQVLPTQVNVRIYAIHTSGPVLAEASANLNGCFTIRGLKVVDVGNGPFISMPDYRTGGGYRDALFFLPTFFLSFHAPSEFMSLFLSLPLFMQPWTDTLLLLHWDF